MTAAFRDWHDPHTGAALGRSYIACARALFAFSARVRVSASHSGVEQHLEASARVSE